MRKLNNRAFSLVELIIVMAMMVIIVGVLAPQYVKYLEHTKKTEDCSTLSTVLNACETIALDPNTVWQHGDTITIRVTVLGATYTGGAATSLDEVVPASGVRLESEDWGVVEIDATKNIDNSVTFDVSNDSLISEMAEYSEATSKRLE